MEVDLGVLLVLVQLGGEFGEARDVGLLVGQLGPELDLQ